VLAIYRYGDDADELIGLFCAALEMKRLGGEHSRENKRPRLTSRGVIGSAAQKKAK